MASFWGAYVTVLVLFITAPVLVACFVVFLYETVRAPQNWKRYAWGNLKFTLLTVLLQLLTFIPVVFLVGVITGGSLYYGTMIFGLFLMWPIGVGVFFWIRHRASYAY